MPVSGFFLLITYEWYNYHYYIMYRQQLHNPKKHFSHNVEKNIKGIFHLHLLPFQISLLHAFPTQTLETAEPERRKLTVVCAVAGFVTSYLGASHCFDAIGQWYESSREFSTTAILGFFSKLSDADTVHNMEWLYAIRRVFYELLFYGRIQGNIHITGRRNIYAFLIFSVTILLHFYSFVSPCWCK